MPFNAYLVLYQSISSVVDWYFIMPVLKTALALATVNILFGTGYPFVKTVIHYIDPSTWVFVRASLSALLLITLFHRRVDLGSQALKKAGWLLVAAFFGIMLNQVCFVEGLARTTPAHASIINATIPLQTLLYGWFFIRERISLSKIIGVVFGFTGVGILLRFDQTSLANPYLVGDLLIFVNSASYSLYLVIAKKVLGNVGPLTAITWMSVFGAMGIGLYSGWDIPATQIATLAPKIWLFMAYLVLVPTVLTYSLNLWALKHVEASHAALFVYFQPLVATILSYFMLGDVPDSRFYVSAVLICSGVLLGSFNICSINKFKIFLSK